MSTNDISELFLSMIEANKGIIYKIANSYCTDPEDRKDLFQEIVLKLWQSFNNYDQKFKPSTWIYRIALNTAISFYRKEKTRNKIAVTFSENFFNLSDSEHNNQRDRSTFFLNQFIFELKELDKALMLLYLEEKNYKEIAEIFGITETNVSTKIARIKSVLKQKFLKIPK